jgi:hypothetical protein
MIKLTKVEFRKRAVENGLAPLGRSKRPLAEIAAEIQPVEPFNGWRDDVSVTAGGILKRKFTRDGKEVESYLELTKYSEVYQLPNGYYIVHNQYPETPGTAAWELNLIYA